MKKTTFTDTMIRKLKPEESDYTRSEGNGFTIRVMPSGSKTWLYLYTIDGKRRKMNLGCYPEVTLETARGKFEDARRKVKNGVDPLDEQEAAKQEQITAFTVAKLVEEFVTKWVKKSKSTRSAYNDERALNVDVVPAWGKRKAKDIRRRDAILLMEQVAERAPGQAQYLAKVCRKMFSFGLQREIVEINPFVEMVKTIPELSPTRRDRVLSADEVKTVWHGIDLGAGSEATKQILKMILATGQRPSEVCGMRQSEIDGDWWTIPAARMKNKKSHRVFLTKLAKSLIPDTENEIIFSADACDKTDRRAIHVGTLSYALKRSNCYGVTHWTPHDLRRTCRTFLSEIGIPREHAEAVISHTLQGVEGTYNRHTYDKEKQAALESWERKLQAIITGKSSDNVVSITRAKGTRRAA